MWPIILTALLGFALGFIAGVNMMAKLHEPKPSRKKVVRKVKPFIREEQLN